MKLRPLRKKGAIELGVGTMVIIVIAVVLLILALIFIGRIFTGATYNVDQLNDAVRNKINGIFGQEGGRIALYLSQNTAPVKQGETFGLAFGIQNTLGGATPITEFSYTIFSDTPPAGCVTNPDTWIVLRKEGEFNIPSGDIEYGLVSFKIPEDESVECLAGFKLSVYKTKNKISANIYDSELFNIQVKAKGFGGLF